MGGRSKYKSFEAKLVKRLLVPYFLAELLCYPFFIAKEYYLGHISRIIFYTSPVESFLGIFIGKATLLPIPQIWFLPCFLLSEIIFVKLFNQLAKNFSEIFGAAIIVMAYVGFILSQRGYLLWGFNVALVSQTFLLAGILIKRYNIVERLNIKVCLLLEIVFIVALLFNERVEMSAAIYGNPLLFYAGGIAGTLLVMKLSALMSTGNKIFSLIGDCGRQSMMILVLHLLVIEFIYNLFVRNELIATTELYNNPAIIFTVTLMGTIVPLWIAKHFGKLPVLKNFCA